MNESFKKLIFIIGCPRSGTTKLAELLSNHPDIFVSSETHFFNINWGFQSHNNSLLKLIRDISNEQLHHLLEDFYQHYRIQDFLQLANIESLRITQLCKNLLNQDDTDREITNSELFKQFLFTALMQASKEKMPNENIFCEKTPQHLLNVHEIHRLFPNAKFIHVKRDGRDVVNSLLKMPWRPAGLINNARFWRKYARFGEKLENDLACGTLSGNLISIEFVELLKNPTETLKYICKFIDIQFSESMLKHDNKQKVFADWEKQWKHKANSNIDPSRSGAYKKELSKDDQIILNHFLHKDLTALGYEVDLSDFKLKHLILIWGSYIELFKTKLLRCISNEK